MAEGDEPDGESRRPGNGAISINPCQDPKVLADWYSRFGIETKEFRGGFYGKLNTAAGLFAFGIHPKKADAPAKCTASVSVVYRVENFESSLSALKSKGLTPDKTESDPDQGQFAHFHDPDGNEVTIWGGAKMCAPWSTRVESSSSQGSGVRVAGDPFRSGLPGMARR